MSQTYNLVNPFIQGSIKTSVKADNSVKAANKLYENISEHFNNDVPLLNITIQKGTNGKFYHFQIKEKKANQEIDWSVEPYVLKDNNKVKSFKNKLNNFKNKIKVGGKKDKDKDSSSESSIDSPHRNYKKYYYNTATFPISYFWYDPYIYSLDTFFIPTFYAPLTPYIEIAIN